MKVLGIDEAGRGPVIGSMFIGGFMVEEQDLEAVEELGVKDSKKLSDGRREDLREELDSLGETFLKEVTADEIDELREVMSLNEIELKGFADLIERAEPERVVMDLPEPDSERFIGKVKDLLPASGEGIEFVAEHGADDEFPIVSAASIVAKSARESHVDELKQKYGYDFRSGYPHDEPTIEFLEKFVEEKGELPPETRLSWSTAERILREAGQSGLGEF
ncbi:MAG: ribonuclease HII [Candidatus Nanohaloarchaea archaeon]